MIHSGSTQNHRRLAVDRQVKAAQLKRAAIENKLSARLSQKDAKPKS